MKKGLTFDDVCLVPRRSSLKSRTEPDVSTKILGQLSKYPILNAPMDSVISSSIFIDYKLANKIIDNGGIPVWNRFSGNVNSCYDYLMDMYFLSDITVLQDRFIMSCGANIDEAKAVLDRGYTNLLIDIANGYQIKILDMISELMVYQPYAKIIGGNICTAQGALDQINSGASGIRCGIGGGAYCTTRMMTGVGVPQFTAIVDCVDVVDRFDGITLIADGGINHPRDMVLSLAAGADCVMMGQRISRCIESSAEKRFDYDLDGNVISFDVYGRGQASLEYQKSQYGSIKTPGTVCEGVSGWLRGLGTFQEFLDEYVGGLRSAMTYIGAEDINQLQLRTEFMEVTPSYKAESLPRM